MNNNNDSLNQGYINPNGLPIHFNINAQNPQIYYQAMAQDPNNFAHAYNYMNQMMMNPANLGGMYLAPENLQNYTGLNLAGNLNLGLNAGLGQGISAANLQNIQNMAGGLENLAGNLNLGLTPNNNSNMAGNLQNNLQMAGNIGNLQNMAGNNQLFSNRLESAGNLSKNIQTRENIQNLQNLQNYQNIGNIQQVQQIQGNFQNSQQSSQNLQNQVRNLFKQLFTHIINTNNKNNADIAKSLMDAFINSKLSADAFITNMNLQNIHHFSNEHQKLLQEYEIHLNLSRAQLLNQANNTASRAQINNQGTPINTLNTTINNTSLNTSLNTALNNSINVNNVSQSNYQSNKDGKIPQLTMVQNQNQNRQNTPQSTPNLGYKGQHGMGIISQQGLQQQQAISQQNIQNQSILQQQAISQMMIQQSGAQMNIPAYSSIVASMGMSGLGGIGGLGNLGGISGMTNLGGIHNPQGNILDFSDLNDKMGLGGKVQEKSIVEPVEEEEEDEGDICGVNLKRENEILDRLNKFPQSKPTSQRIEFNIARILSLIKSECFKKNLNVDEEESEKIVAAMSYALEVKLRQILEKSTLYVHHRLKNFELKGLHYQNSNIEQQISYIEEVAMGKDARKMDKSKKTKDVSDKKLKDMKIGTSSDAMMAAVRGSRKIENFGQMLDDTKMNTSMAESSKHQRLRYSAQKQRRIFKRDLVYVFEQDPTIRRYLLPQYVYRS